MKTVTKTVKELVDNIVATGEDDAPLPLAVIPNHMGINLVAVEALTWTRQDDGQLVSLTIHFIPSKDPRGLVAPAEERARSSPGSGWAIPPPESGASRA